MGSQTCIYFHWKINKPPYDDQGSITNSCGKISVYIRGLSVKFVDTANKTLIKYQRLIKVCINKYQLSGTMHKQYDSMFVNID